MIQVKTITALLDQKFPHAYQESYDNCGLLVGDPDQETDKILICVDVTEDVMEEAIAEGCGLVVSHHPLIFGGLKKITGQTYVERIVRTALVHKVAIYAIHTNLDNHISGLNQILAGKLGLQDLQILSPKNETLRKLITFCPPDHAEKVREAIFTAGAGHIGDYDSCSYNTLGEGTFRALDNANPFVGNKNELHFEKEIKIEAIYPVYLEKKIISKMIEAHPYEEVAYDILLLGNVNTHIGSGMLGTLKETTTASDFLMQVKNRLGLPIVRFSGNAGSTIQKVALCGGSGSFLLKDAMKAGADAFLTADLKYHDYFVPEGKMVLADIGHYESEQFSKELIAEILKKNFPNFAVLKTRVNTNPVKYL